MAAYYWKLQLNIEKLKKTQKKKLGLPDFHLVSPKIRDRKYPYLVERTISYKLLVSDIENYARLKSYGPNSVCPMHKPKTYAQTNF